jgi:PLP dependent protein
MLRPGGPHRVVAYQHFLSVPLWLKAFVSISNNIAEIRQRFATAAQCAGREPSEISLMAVSKTFSSAHIREAYNAGIRLFGENRVQEFAKKVADLSDLKDAEWHLIGHLQTNKATKAAELFSTVDSVDSWKLAQKLNSAAGALGKRLPVLIEINIGGEAAKSGIGSVSKELEELLLAAPELEHLEIRGLMTVPPFADDPQQSRPYFRKVRELRDQIAARQLPAISMNVLSMGMSHDFEVAIEEGSTCVRVGTAIFGARSKTNEFANGH